MIKYAIDASILINLSIFAPRKYHDNFWVELAKQINNGNIILLDSIAAECRGREFKNWFLSVQKSVVPVDSQTKSLAQQIAQKHNIITTDPRGQTRSVADTHLIAYAKLHNLTVFSYETPRRGPNNPMKIPDVCRLMSVPYQRLTIPVMNNLVFSKCS